MKNLKLKMKDLTNPTILSHHEIKNIMGGSDEVTPGSGKIVAYCWGYSTWLGTFNVSECPHLDTLMRDCKGAWPETVRVECNN